MIAPLWDDLNPGTTYGGAGDIYEWYDATNHLFIIQFDEVPIWGTNDLQTFQVVFFHRDYYPTPTGDSRILFQYHTVSNPSLCTIGIENLDQTDGIGYLYDGVYGADAAPLANGSAVLFTTSPPVEPSLPWLALDGIVVDDSAGNDNGLAEPGETVSLELDLSNGGAASATAPSGTLTTSEGLVSILDGAALFADIPTGGSGSNAGDPFTIHLSQAVSDTIVTLWAVIEANGEAYSVPVRCELHVSLSGTGVTDTPIEFAVLHSCPNPFTDSTTLALALPDAAPVELSVYNTAGKLVRRVDHGVLAAGRHILRWDGRDGSGRTAASGVYFLRVEAGNRSVDRKTVLLR